MSLSVVKTPEIYRHPAKTDRLLSPLYGPALLLLLAACHRPGHIGPKPSTAEAMPPFIADTIEGLDGPNTMSFAEAEARVYTDLRHTEAQPDQVRFYNKGDLSSAGAAAGMDLTAYDNLIGSAYDDHLMGSDADNIIVGEGGNDMIEGHRGRDILYGAYGNDRLFGGGDEDMLYGGQGDDLLVGGWQADMMDGGPGVDTASYTPSHVGVYVDLMTDGPQHGGRNDKGNHAYGDVLKHIENLIGSNNMRPKRGDTLLGDDGPNRIDGRAGYDVIDGRGGDDVLIGGRHRDILTGGEGADIFVLDVETPAASLQLADLITDFSAEDSLDIGDLSHIWMQTDSDSGVSHAENDQNLHDTIIYAGNAENTAPDSSKILAVLLDYTPDGVSDDFTTQPVIAEVT